MSLNLGSVRLDLVANTSKFVRGMTMAQQSLNKTGAAARKQEQVIKNLEQAEARAHKQYARMAADRSEIVRKANREAQKMAAATSQKARDQAAAYKSIAAAQQRAQRAAKKYADVQKGLGLFNIKAAKRANKELKDSAKALAREEKRLVQIRKSFVRVQDRFLESTNRTKYSLQKSSTAMAANREKVRGLRKELKVASNVSKRFRVNLGAIAGAAVGAVAAFYVLQRAVSSVFRVAEKASTVSRELEVELKRVGAVSNATSGELEMLKKQSLDLAVTFSQSATKLAEGMGFLGMAGFSATEIFQAMPSVTKLATIGMMDFGAAADIASNIMTQWLIPATEVGKVVDLMAATITTSNTNIRQMGDAMKYVAPVANSAGLEIEEIAAAIGLLGNAGIQGEMSGTALRNSITRLLNPSKKSAKIITSLGIEVKDSTGNMKPLVNILGDLEASGITTGEALQVFGQRAGPGMISLLQQGSAELARYRFQLELMEGVSDTLAKDILNSFDARVKKLNASFARFAEVVGTEVNVFLSGYVDILTKAFSDQENMTAAMGRTQDALAGLAEGLKAFLDIVHTIAKPLMVLNRLFQEFILIIELLQYAVLGTIMTFGEYATALTDLVGITDGVSAKIGRSVDKMARNLRLQAADADAAWGKLPATFEAMDSALATTTGFVDAGTEAWRRQLVERAKIEASNQRIAHLTGNISSIYSHLDKETSRLWGLMSSGLDESSGALDELNKQFAAGAMHFDNLGGAFSMLSSEFGSSDAAFKTIQMAIDGLGAGADRGSSDVASLIASLKKLQSYKAFVDSPGSGRRKKDPDLDPKKPKLDLSIQDAEIKLLKEQIKNLKLVGKEKGLVHGENKKLIATQKMLINLNMEKAWLKAAHEYGEGTKKANEAMAASTALAAAQMETLKTQTQLSLWESVMATPSIVPEIEKESEARKKALEELKKMEEEKRKELLETHMATKDMVLAETGKFQGMFDASIVGEQIEYLTEQERRRYALINEEGAKARIEIEDHNKALVEQVELYNGLADTLFAASEGYLEVAFSLGEIELAATEAEKAQAKLGVAMGAASGAGAIQAGIFNLLAEQLGETPAEKAKIKAGGKAWTGAGEVGMGLLGVMSGEFQGLGMVFSGLQNVGRGVSDFISADVAEGAQAAKITSPAGTKKREREREDTTKAIVDALKEAGLYRPDVREQTLQFFGSDVLSLQQGRNSEARRQRVLQEVNLRDRF